MLYPTDKDNINKAAEEAQRQKLEKRGHNNDTHLKVMRKRYSQASLIMIVLLLSVARSPGKEKKKTKVAGNEEEFEV